LLKIGSVAYRATSHLLSTEDQFQLQKMMFLICNFFLALTFLYAADESDFVIDRRDLKDPLNAGDKLIISNSIGDIRLRGGGNGVVEVHAVIQNLMKGTPMPEINFKREGKTLTLMTSFTQNPQGKQDRIDLVAFVPEKISTQVKTTFGEIDIKGIKDDVSATSEKGKITIRSVMGHVESKNDSGSISVELLPEVTNRPQSFLTTTGDISLFFPNGIHSNVDVQTSGEISTDFTIQIDFDEKKEPAKIGKSVIGRGGQKISASSKRGKIRLLRIENSIPDMD
jgi:hypothetical protein